MKNLAISMITSASLLAACGDDNDDAMDTSILGTAQATSELSTLTAVVEFASENDDLVDLLADPGTLTVFAPTNSAFDALAVELGAAKATDLLTAANKPLLRDVLTYHVLASEVMSSGIPFGKPIETAGGGIFKIDAGAPPVVTDGRNRTANITATDIDASNGVVHLVDRVLLPADKTIVETAQSLSDFSILVDAVIAAGLVETLSGPGPFTVFAPTNAAFAALLTELGVTKEQLLADTALLTAVLTYHVVPARVFKADAPIGSPVTTVQQATFTIDAAMKLNDGRGRQASITATDVLTENGVIHVIDKVILPPL